MGRWSHRRSVHGGGAGSRSNPGIRSKRQAGMPIFITTIHSPLPMSDVHLRLGSLIEERTGWASGILGAGTPSRSGALFAGTRDDDSFRIVRLIRYRNSFLPVIRGRLVRGATGTDVRLVMMLHPAVAVFMGLWCAGLVFGVARTLAQSFAPALALGPLLMCLFGVLLTGAGFFPEAVKARRLIRDALRP